MDASLPYSPAAERNQGPILAVLEEVLPPNATVLEIASGSGQHAAHFAAARPAWTWQPTEADAPTLASIAARTAGLANVRSPLRLDVLAQPWPQALGRFDALYCANLLHISAWATCAALIRGAADQLAPGGVLLLYGPYVVDGEPLAPSNAAFDADLRSRNPAWGLRRLSDVVEEAARAGLAFERRWDMAANNLLLAFRQAPSSSSVPAARLLGYAGLVPFIAGAAWVWATRATPAGAFAAFALEAYAATIVAFLGGVHWGPALRNGGRDVASLAWGVALQLAAWLALLLPSRPALGVLALLLAVGFVFDRRMYVRAGLADWLPMRLQLTAGAVAGCLAAAAA